MGSRPIKRITGELQHRALAAIGVGDLEAEATPNGGTGDLNKQTGAQRELPLAVEVVAEIGRHTVLPPELRASLGRTPTKGAPPRTGRRRPAGIARPPPSRTWG